MNNRKISAQNKALKLRTYAAHWKCSVKFRLKFTCGLMFPRYKLVVDGSPTSWEPGAQSSKTAETEKRQEFSYCCLTEQHIFLAK